MSHGVEISESASGYIYAAIGDSQLDCISRYLFRTCFWFVITQLPPDHDDLAAPPDL